MAEVQLLLQLRKHLMGVKRAIEVRMQMSCVHFFVLCVCVCVCSAQGLQAPLLMAQRRTAMGGLAASAAADKASASHTTGTWQERV